MIRFIWCSTSNTDASWLHARARVLAWRLTRRSPLSGLYQRTAEPRRSNVGCRYMTGRRSAKPGLRFVAETVEELPARPDRGRSVEVDSKVFHYSECGSVICFVLESHSIAALQKGPSQSSSTVSARLGRTGSEKWLPLHPQEQTCRWRCRLSAPFLPVLSHKQM